MWFRRSRRRPQLDLAALDRLSEAIARAVSLLEERLRAAEPTSGPVKPVAPVIHREAEPTSLALPEEPEERAEPEAPEAPEKRAEPEAPELEAVDSFVLFVPTAAGYRLALPEGVIPERGELLRVEDEWYCVLRMGPSPLPGDGRRCAFLEHRPDILN